MDLCVANCHTLVISFGVHYHAHYLSVSLLTWDMFSLLVQIGNRSRLLCCRNMILLFSQLHAWICFFLFSRTNSSFSLSTSFLSLHIQLSLHKSLSPDSLILFYKRHRLNPTCLLFLIDWLLCQSLLFLLEECTPPIFLFSFLFPFFLYLLYIFLITPCGCHKSPP